MNIASICLGPLATNCYLVEENGRRVLIDPAEDSTVLRDFVGDRSIDAIVNTHGHFDHVGGDWAFPDVPIRIHAGDLPFLEATRSDRPGAIHHLQDGDRVLESLVVVHTPGHSPGSVVLVGGGVLFAGDLLFAGSIGRVDLPGGSPNDMFDSLRRIVALPGDYTVYPGHGEETTLDVERRRNQFLRGLGDER